jgi:hypothetical protein
MFFDLHLISPRYSAAFGRVFDADAPFAFVTGPAPVIGRRARSCFKYRPV